MRRGGRAGPLRVLALRARSYVRGIFRRGDVEREMREEFRHHIEMRTADLIASGMTRGDASRKAHREFGHIETHRQAARAARGLRLFDELRFSWLDVKLGLRMLVKNPALTAVAVFALAAGIPVGLAPVHVADAITAPLPEDPEDRIRTIRLYDPAMATVVRTNARDYRYWSGRLSSFSSLGAYRTSSYGIESDDGRSAPVQGAEVTPSVFGVLGTPPLLGRTLVASDGVPGGADVVVLGHDVWQARFGGDPGLVGRTILVAGVPHTVVGVMPPDFLFPHRQQLWLALRLEAGSADVRRAESGSRAGSSDALAVFVMGRLARGATAEQAQVEAAATGLRPAAERENERSDLRVEVVPFAMAFIGVPAEGLEALPEYALFRLLAMTLLLIACGNVAMLMFARTATRLRELAVRTALGASRLRVISQLFAEALVVSILATGVGLIAVDVLLERALSVLPELRGALPYWLRLDVTGEAVTRGLLLAVLSAVVAGVLPAWRLTSGKVQMSIQRAGAGRSGLRFGGITGALIIADVAISIAAVSFAFQLVDRLTDTATLDELVGIPAAEYLAAELRLPPSAVALDDTTAVGDAFVARLAATQAEVVARLEAEPGVRAVAVADALPRMDHRMRRVEVRTPEGVAEQRWMRTAQVDVDFFADLNRPILAGRGFTRADLDGGRPVVVNTVFVERILAGRDPLGLAVRFVTGSPEPQPWHEIVGVVGHLGVNIVNPRGDVGVYLPVAQGGIHPLQLGIHTAGEPEEFVVRLREIVAEVDPVAILGTPSRLDEVYQGDWYLMIGVAGGLSLLVGILIALAASGLYAIVSFSVSERTREIGVRAALGAGRRSLVLAVLRRALLQIGIGALVGIPLAARVAYELREEVGDDASVLVAVAIAVGFGLAIVTVVALCSCLVPARRALRIQPQDALRAEA